MSFISRAFRGRPRDEAPAGRLPPGQYLVTDFPVLSAGPTPRTPLTDWSFRLLAKSTSHDDGPGMSSANSLPKPSPRTFTVSPSGAS